MAWDGGVTCPAFSVWPSSRKKKQSFLFGFYRASLQDLFWVSDLLLKISFIVIYPLKIVIFHSYVGHGLLFIDDNLLGGLEHGWIMTFHSVGNAIIPTDEHIFQRDR